MPIGTLLDDPLLPQPDPIDPWPHPAALPDDQLLSRCEFGQGRSGGPGGQHRNKVETKVTLLHTPTGISAKAGERREMSANKRAAVRRLRLALATEHRTPVPIGPIGSVLWRSRIRPRKLPDGTTAAAIAVNPDHRDYPSLLAEALDVIADANHDLPKAALRLGVSASQLLKLLRLHPPALAALNNARAHAHKRPLK